MHWLEEQVQRLGALAQAVPDADRNGHFLDALHQVVEAVGKHDGVTACSPQRPSTSGELSHIPELPTRTPKGGPT